MPTLLGSDNNPTGMNNWQIEASPPNAGTAHPSTVRLVISSRGRSRMTASGVVAVLGALSTHLSAAKTASIHTRAGIANPGIALCRDGGWIDILPEDGPALVATLVGLFQTAANTTAS